MFPQWARQHRLHVVEFANTKTAKGVSGQVLSDRIRDGDLPVIQWRADYSRRPFFESCAGHRRPMLVRGLDDIPDNESIQALSLLMKAAHSGAC
jgi:hypothetical protein